MGVIKRGILGGFSGSVGNVVGSSWKGIATMKAKPLSVANPNTAGQVAQRTKMTNAVEYAKEILTDIIKPLNDRFASAMSGFNLFIQRNIDLFAAADPTPPQDLIIAQGNVEGFDTFAVSGDVSNNEIVFSWVDNTGTGDSLATDVPFVFVYNETLNEIAVGDNTGVDRSIQGLSITPLPTGWVAGNVLRAYGAFRRADGSKVSNTSYATANIVA